MMLRLALVGAAILAAALLQTTVFPHLTVAGFRPDLFALVTVAFALRDGPATGVRVGFASGLVADLLLHESAVGISALVLLAVGYAVGSARPYLAFDSVPAPLVLAFGATVAATAGHGLLSRLLGEERYTLDLVVSASVFVGLYTTLLAPLVLRWAQAGHHASSDRGVPA